MTALVPEMPGGDLADYLRDLGSKAVIEMSHGRTVRLANGLEATCYINLTDSMLVLDDGETVL